MIRYIESLRHYKDEDLYLGDLLWLSEQAKDEIINHILKEYPWSSNFYAEERFAKFQVGPCLYEGLPGGEEHISRMKVVSTNMNY